MSQNLHTLFQSKFYIDESYGLSLVPQLVKSFTAAAEVEKTQEQLISSAVSLNQNSSVDSKSKSVVIINFNQTVIKYNYGGWIGTQTLMFILEGYRNDPSIAGVVMRMDTGGGQVYGTPEYYDYIVEFKKTKPFVVYTDGYLCSGGYYMAAPADWIVANKRADAIGSIGAYTILINYNGILEKYGAVVKTIYAEESPEKNKSHRDVMSGIDKDGSAYATKELSPIVVTFADDMKGTRSQIKEKAFEGGTWNGVEALEMGLVDELGTIDTAVAKVYELDAAKNGNTNNSNKSNSKKKAMSKTKGFPAVQKVVGIEGVGIATISTMTGKKGMQISEAQIESLESALTERDAAIKTAEGNVTVATGKVTTMETAVDAAITASGLKVEANATTETKIALLGSTVKLYGDSNPGGKITKPGSVGDSTEDADDDKSTSLFQGINN